MTSLTIELPDRLAQVLATFVEEGWFKDEGEAVRLALLEFLRRHRLELAQKYQLADIEWALQQKGKSE